MKHSYRPECDCTRCMKEAARRFAQSCVDHAAGRQPRPGSTIEHRASQEQPFEFTETARGARARTRWAERYDALNGAPEGEWDR